MAVLYAHSWNYVHYTHVRLYGASERASNWNAWNVSHALLWPERKQTRTGWRRQFFVVAFLCFSPCRNGTRLASQITLRLHRNRIAWCRWLCVIFLHLCFVSWLFAGSLHWIMYECTAHTHRWANVWHSECRPNEQDPFLSITISVSMCNKQQQQQKHSTQRWILVFVSKSSYIRSHMTGQSTFFCSKQQISK